MTLLDQPAGEPLLLVSATVERVALVVGATAAGWLVLLLAVAVASRGLPYDDRVRRLGRCGAPARLARVLSGVVGVVGTTALAAPGVAAGVPAPEVAHLRPPDRVEVAASAPAPRPTRPRVVVRPGDTLWDLAATTLPPHTGDALVDRTWRAVYRANRARVGPDPDRLVPGTVLRLPPPTRPTRP